MRPISPAAPVASWFPLLSHAIIRSTVSTANAGNMLSTSPRHCSTPTILLASTIWFVVLCRTLATFGVDGWGAWSGASPPLSGWRTDGSEAKPPPFAGATAIVAVSLEMVSEEFESRTAVIEGCPGSTVLETVFA